VWHLAIFKEKSSLIGYVFVDNFNLTRGKLYPIVNDTDDVTNDIQHTIDIWEQSLKTTGRAICPNKSFTCVISF